MATQEFPTGWLIASDFDPNDHMMQLKGRDYLNVQYRLLWFIRDQRALIVAGLAKTSYVVQTDLVEMDRDTSWAHFKTYVRDVLGNEATMYGSESAKDFADYAEKASTKSLGRALLALGYGTAAAPEMDEGERVVDSPVERKPAPQPQQQKQAQPQPPRAPAAKPAADDTQKVVTPQMARDRARIHAAPTAETPIAYTEEPSPTAENVGELAGLVEPSKGAMTTSEFIRRAKTELDLSPKQAMTKLGVTTLMGLNLDEAYRRLMPHSLEGLPVAGMH